MPEGDNPYKKITKNAISRGLVNAADDDFVIISDLDEIPNPKKIKFLKKKWNMLCLNKCIFTTKLIYRAKLIHTGLEVEFV